MSVTDGKLFENSRMQIFLLSYNSEIIFEQSVQVCSKFDVPSFEAKNRVFEFHCQKTNTFKFV